MDLFEWIFRFVVVVDDDVYSDIMGYLANNRKREKK